MIKSFVKSKDTTFQELHNLRNGIYFIYSLKHLIALVNIYHDIFKGEGSVWKATKYLLCVFKLISLSIQDQKHKQMCQFL